MGCSSLLMATIAETRRIAHSHQLHSGDLGAQRGNVRRVETTLFTMIQWTKGVPPDQLLCETSDTEDAVSTLMANDEIDWSTKRLVLSAEARRQSAILFLYGSVFELPPTNAVMQSRVTKSLLCLRAVVDMGDRTGSATNNGGPQWGMSPTLWPLFITGLLSTKCERASVLDMLGRIEEQSFLGVSLVSHLFIISS